MTRLRSLSDESAAGARLCEMRARQPHECLWCGLVAAARLQRHCADCSDAAGLLVGAVRPQVRVARRCAILRRHDASLN
ncbi:hypothetical protein BJS_09012 [Bradyrhizobium japonicum SEMIA 5079]|nr:hypothetical protein BJS_09012 [Bradyrhizobium japonicum SEMIA 5079]